MTVPFNLPLLAVAAVATARASRARREEQEADDQRYATLCRKQAQLRSLEDEPLLVDEPMIEQNHQITPPPELVEQWYASADDANEDVIDGVANRAARWGADAELEACVKWVSEYCPYFGDYPLPEDKLRAARRPQPPSLKEQALEVFEALIHGDSSGLDVGVIRRALEQLDD